jgi:predicted GNAT family acetyltransferase
MVPAPAEILRRRYDPPRRGDVREPRDKRRRSPYLQRMAELDPLAHPVWAALTGRQSHLALAQGAARRFDPEVGVFAAVPDWSEASVADLRALVRARGHVGIVKPEAPPAVAGLVAEPQGTCCQMVAEAHVAYEPPAFACQALGDADAAEMFALAALTRPGPYFSHTHTLGDFFGVKVDGRLVAMAGERMRPDGFTEVSGVCTHPDHRGHGYAAGLMHVLAERIRRRGEVPFLHVYAGNSGAIRLYKQLGYRVRRTVEYVLLREG